jgi:hypothetical protein
VKVQPAARTAHRARAAQEVVQVTPLEQASITPQSDSGRLKTITLGAMRRLRAALSIGFVGALITVYVVVYVRQPVGWAVWALLAVGVSMMGGVAIGKRWAVRVAFATNALSSLLLIATVALLAGHVGGHPAFLLVQVLVSTGATAAGVRLRSMFAGKFATPS